MSSSMSTGDRRWTSSTRRSGMTVLGKVAVPKPINLPSQKLENHGVDPNVEIVPKGTHSWGSKTSQTNAWGSSSVSPSADGGTGSPSHLSGRPSSVGSNTRPSTAGSDRLHEPAVNAWGPNSRPSSASGALSSNQSSLSTLRPRSADTRPGSSQLSRFAEPLSEYPVAIGGTTDRGLSSSKNEGFSLTSGDFPTLGSEKENSAKNMGSQGDTHVIATSDSGATNTWRRDEQHFGEDDRPLGKREEDAHSYPNASMPPHRFETWHGPPLNNPSGGGVWYRGPPYGAPLPPGGFPMEPFPFYSPHFPANSLGNPQPVPPRGAGPRGHQPMSGEMYRPLMPDAYIRPSLPVRPGFYPGPVPYESYYRPPMGYHNPNEQEMSFMGMPRGPVYTGFPGLNARDPANFHVGSGGHTGKALSTEQVESDHFNDSRGPYKLLMKQHNSSDGRSCEQLLENPVATDIEKGGQHRHHKLEVENKKDEMKTTQRAEQSEISPSVSDKHTGSNSVSVHSSERVGNKKLPNIRSSKKVEISTSSSGVSRPIPPVPRDSTLFQKIEGLNAKARVSDTQLEVMSDCSREGQDNKSQINPKAFISANSGGTGSLSSEGFQSCGTRKPATRGADFSSRRYTGKQNRIDDHAKGILTQELDSWRKTTPAADSFGKVSGSSSVIDTSEYSDVHYAAAEGRDMPATYSQRKHWGGPARQMLDGNDSRGQGYANMREPAKQHSMQLQNVGEQMTKQKIKALEKPKEFKRNPYGLQDSNQKLDNVSGGAVMNKKEEFCTLPETNMIAVRSLGRKTGSISAPNPNPVAPLTVDDASRTERPTSCENLQERMPNRTQKDSAAVQKQPLSFQVEVNNLDVGNHSNVPQDRANTVSKHKRSAYKHKHNVPSQNVLADDCLSSGNDVPPKLSAAEVTTSVEVSCKVASSGDSSAPASQKEISESPVHQKRRSNWNGKGRLSGNDAPTSASIPLMKAEISNTAVESGNTETVKSELVLRSVQSGIDSRVANPSSEQRQNEEIPEGMSSQWKSQHSRRMPKNPQGNRSSRKFHSGDAVMWAPVRSQNIIEVTYEDNSQDRSEVTDNDIGQGNGQGNVLEAAVSPQRVDHHVQTNSKSKRAEIERYVAKPAAKELTQQENIRHSVAPSRGQSPVGKTAERVDCGLQYVEAPQTVGTTIGKEGPGIESRNENARYNKQGKAHGSWRQRSSESSNMQGLHYGSSYSSNTSKNISMNTKPDSAIEKEQSQECSDLSASDGWNMPDCPNTVAQTTSVKDWGATARGKRHFSKGLKGAGNSYDLDKNSKNEEGDKIQTDFTSAEENYDFAERPISHWKPRPRGASYQRGGRISGRNDIRSNKREYLPQIGVPQQPKEASQVIGETHSGHTVSEKSNVDGVPDQYKREKKPSSSSVRPRSPNQTPAGLTELISPVTLDTRQGQNTSSHRNIRSDRLSEEHDTNPEWSLAEKDYRQQNQSRNWERQRNNANYQYKLVGPYNNRSNENQGSKDGFQETGSKYAERGQTHSRRGRGNAYPQQHGHVR